MTVKGNIIYITTKDITEARLNTAEVAELEEALLASGYELSVEPTDAR